MEDPLGIVSSSARQLPDVLGRSGVRKCRVAVVIAAVTGVVLLAAPVPLAAHAVVLDVEPADGVTLDVAPPAVEVTFNEPVGVVRDASAVRDDRGEVVSGDVMSVDNRLVIELPNTLANGSYVVSWQVVSADSHVIGASSVFHVGAPSRSDDELTTAAASTGATGLTPTVVIVGGVAYGGALTAAGLWGFARWWRRRSDADRHGQVGDDTALRRLDQIGFVAAVTGLGATVALAALRVIERGDAWSALFDGAIVRDVLTGPVGAAAVATAFGLAALATTWRQPPSRSRNLVGWAAVGVALVGFVLVGHSRTRDPRWVMVTGDVIHLAAGAVWLGGVVALVIALRHRAPDHRRAAADVSFAALIAVAAATVSGVAMSVAVIDEFAALWNSSWGVVLLAKVSVVVVLVALGGYHRFVALPRLDPSDTDRPAASDATGRSLGRFRRTLQLEAAGFAIVLVLTALLVGRSPIPSDTADSAQPTRAITELVELSSGAGTLLVHIDPVRRGDNDVTIRAKTPTGEPLTAVEPPRLQLRESTRDLAPLETAGHAIGDGSYHAIITIPFDGTWELTIRFRTGDFESGLVQIPLNIGPNND